MSHQEETLGVWRHLIPVLGSLPMHGLPWPMHTHTVDCLSVAPQPSPLTSWKTLSCTFLTFWSSWKFSAHNNWARKWRTHWRQCSNVTTARAETQLLKAEFRVGFSCRGTSKASPMLLPTILVAFLKIPTSCQDVVIDLSKAQLDEETGNFCVIQKVRDWTLKFKHKTTPFSQRQSIMNLIQEHFAPITLILFPINVSSLNSECFQGAPGTVHIPALYIQQVVGTPWPRWQRVAIPGL